MTKNNMTTKKLIEGLKAYVKECLLFQTNVRFNIVLGVYSWIQILLIIFAVYKNIHK